MSQETFNYMKLLVNEQQITDKLMSEKIESLENQLKNEKIKYDDLQLKFNLL